jgi:hypothetical protein
MATIGEVIGTTTAAIITDMFGMTPGSIHTSMVIIRVGIMAIIMYLTLVIIIMVWVLRGGVDLRHMPIIAHPVRLLSVAALKQVV